MAWRSGALVAACGLAVSGARAQPDVAIIAAAGSGGPGTCNFTDPQNILQNSGEFASVTVIDLTTNSPTLQDLMAFDAVMTWTNSTPLNTNTWGDVLADYVDAGGAWW